MGTKEQAVLKTDVLSLAAERAIAYTRTVRQRRVARTLETGVWELSGLARMKSFSVPNIA